MRVAFYTLGCKVNQYETHAMASLFAQGGYDTVDFDDDADVYVINSCTVTEQGDKKTKKYIRKVRSHNPNAVIVLTGCFSQAFPQQAENISGVDIIQGVSNRSSIVKNVTEFLHTRERIIDIIPHKGGEAFEKMSVSSFHEHTRAFVKIEDGCDRYCSYCIIPTARGPIRSKPLDDLKAELCEIAANGYKEVVLVGINLSSYGRDIGLRLVDAVTLACSIDGIMRVRLGSLEPELITDDDLDKMAAQEKFCPQFHLSLQSGCDETLKRMNRHYNSAEYSEIVSKIFRRFENPAITTDIMVGFAGETDAEFEESKQFLVKTGFARAHVFPYSVRPGTKAAEMKPQVPQAIKSLRAKEMLKAAENTQRRFLESQLGSEQAVLFEQKNQNGEYIGYTKNYTCVAAYSDNDISGQILKVRLISAQDEHCCGEIIH